MNSLRQILFILLAVVYLFLSTGVVLFKTHCVCTGNNSVSLFAASESCNDIISDHNCCGDEKTTCENCQKDHQPHSCGCDEPIVTFLKLTDHFNEGSDLEYPFSKQLTLICFFDTESIQVVDTSISIEVFPYYSPPQKVLFGRFLINFLNQRKIALFA